MGKTSIVVVREKEEERKETALKKALQNIVKSLEKDFFNPLVITKELVVGGELGGGCTHYLWFIKEIVPITRSFLGISLWSGKQTLALFKMRTTLWNVPGEMEYSSKLLAHEPILVNELEQLLNLDLFPGVLHRDGNICRSPFKLEMSTSL